MPAARFVEQLNAQIGHEFAAHQQYVACAVHYDLLTMPRMASFFYRQAVEERDHAMMMVQYLVDCDEPVIIPASPAPHIEFRRRRRAGTRRGRAGTAGRRARSTR